jgi:hypothetical protein
MIMMIVLVDDDSYIPENSRTQSFTVIESYPSLCNASSNSSIRSSNSSRCYYYSSTTTSVVVVVVVIIITVR